MTPELAGWLGLLMAFGLWVHIYNWLSENKKAGSEDQQREETARPADPGGESEGGDES